MSKQKTILITDDDEGVRTALRITLEYGGYDVQCASNGQEALRLLSTGPTPSLILLDLMMPVMDGWEFLRIRESDPALLAIPVVVCSAFAEKELQLSSSCSVLLKPIEIDDLLTTVEHQCQ